MLSLFDVQDLISTSFFDGDLQIAGMCIYVLVLLVILALTRKTAQTLLIAIPVTLIFSALGVLAVDMIVLMILVTILGLAFTVRNVWRD